MIEHLIPVTSQNYDDVDITVEFAIVHYTACPSAEALFHLTRGPAGASAHFLIARDGRIFEIVPCLTGQVKRARHAGRSQWRENQRTWVDLNDYSVGIELENFNGNVNSYSEVQYEVLEELAHLLIERFPSLGLPSRWLGHEHVAANRRKCDPGALFDWERFFTSVFPTHLCPQRNPRCSTEVLEQLRALEAETRGMEASTRFALWERVNGLLEAAVSDEEG